MSLVQPYRDGSGRLRARSNATAARVLADFFETDVGESAWVYDEMIEAAETVTTVAPSSPRFTGNVYVATISAQSVTGTNLHDENAPGFSIPRDEFITLLRIWKAAAERS